MYKTPTCKYGKAFLAVSMAAAVFGNMGGCNRGEGQAPQAAGMPPTAVTVTDAVAADVPSYLDEIGRTVATEAVTIQPQVSGRIMEVHFTDGADVKKGDLLFQLDPRPSQAALDQATASLAQSQASVSWSRSELNRVSGLTETGVVSKSDYDQKQNAVATAEAQILASKAAIEAAEVNLDYCTIHSPVDGRLGHRLVDAGNVVNASGMAKGTDLLTIQKMDPIYVDFTVTEREVGAVRQNMSNGTLKVQARLPEDKTPRTGELTFLDNTVQNAAGTVMLRATLDNKDHHFWPGQFVNVRLVLTQLKQAVLIPQLAAQVGQQGHFVFVVHPDGTAEQRNVELGQSQGEQVVVSNGVSAGEKVIIAGQLMVTAGMKVNAMPAGAPPSSVPAAAPATGPSGSEKTETQQP